MAGEVEIQFIPETRVAYMRYVGPYGMPGITHLWQRFQFWCLKEGLTSPRHRMFGIAQDNPNITPPERTRYDACIQVEDGFQPRDGIGVQTIRGGRYACAPFTGTAPGDPRRLDQVPDPNAPRRGPPARPRAGNRDLRAGLPGQREDGRVFVLVVHALAVTLKSWWARHSAELKPAIREQHHSKRHHRNRHFADRADDQRPRSLPAQRREVGPEADAREREQERPAARDSRERRVAAC